MMANPLSLAAGSLRHSISIDQRTTTTDSFGQPVDNWASVLVTRASIEMASERELYSAGMFTSQVTHIITIRWPGILVQIKPGMRVRFGAHTYTIQAVDNVSERSRVLRLFVLEINGSE